MTENPFRSWSPEQVAGMPDVPDVLGEWEAATDNWPFVSDDAFRLSKVGDRMAAELVRTRAMVIALEKSDAALRGLVERARPYAQAVGGEWDAYETSEWEADADRILAPATEADE